MKILKVPILLVLIVLFVTGCDLIQNKDEYIYKCENALDGISDHIFDVGEPQGVEYDDEGRGFEMYIFGNADLDFNILNPYFNEIEGAYDEFNRGLKGEEEHYNEKEIDDIDRVYNCYKTGMFFVYPEKLERAWNEDNNLQFRKEYKNLKDFKEDKKFMSWLKGNIDSQGTTDYDKYLTVLGITKELMDIIELDDTMDGVEKTLEDYDNDFNYYEATGDDYSFNQLVPVYNDILENTDYMIYEYNEFIEGYDEWYLEWYNSFIEVVDLYLLFPEQDDFDVVIYE